MPKHPNPKHEHKVELREPKAKVEQLEAMYPSIVENKELENDAQKN